MPISSMYQRDNAPCHMAKTVGDKIEELELEVMPWPAQSSDWNPIENVWKLLKARISTEKCT